MGFQVLVKCWKFLVKHWKFYPNLTKKETKFSKNVQTQICSNETLLEVLTRLTRRHQVGGGRTLKWFFFQNDLRHPKSKNLKTIIWTMVLQGPVKYFSKISKVCLNLLTKEKFLWLCLFMYKDGRTNKFQHYFASCWFLSSKMRLIFWTFNVSLLKRKEDWTRTLHLVWKSKTSSSIRNSHRTTTS